MANLQKYGMLYLSKDGNLLLENGQVTINRDSRAQEVATISKGFAGMSPGAPILKMSVENAVPAADIEFDAGKIIKNVTTVEMGVLGPGGKTLTSKGYVTSDVIQHGVGASASYNFEFTGQYAEWE